MSEGVCHFWKYPGDASVDGTGRHVPGVEVRLELVKAGAGGWLFTTATICEACGVIYQTEATE